MGRPIHLAIIHANRLFQDCLVTVLSAREHFDVQGFDHTTPNCLESLAHFAPHAVLMDLGLPDPGTAEFARRVRKRLPNARILVLTPANTHDGLLECLAAGVHGCVLEQSSLDELQTAIEVVADGEAFCSPRLAFSVFSRLATAASSPLPGSENESSGLTAREFQVVKLIADGLSNKEIAKRLGVSLYTIKNHVHNIVSKLQVGDRFEAVRFVRRRCGLNDSMGRSVS